MPRKPKPKPALEAPKEEDDVERVEAEIVESIPAPDFPAIPEIDIANLPEGAMPAPPPDQLKYHGYFCKGGRGGPGRKRLYDKPEDMLKAVNDYFSSLQVSMHNPATGRMEYAWVRSPTMPGLARALGMSRAALDNYSKSEEFSEVVEYAKDIYREYLEQKALSGGNQGGTIFVMKNMGYTDTKTYQVEPTSRLAAAQTPEEIAKLVDEDIV